MMQNVVVCSDVRVYRISATFISIVLDPISFGGCFSRGRTAIGALKAGDRLFVKINPGCYYADALRMNIFSGIRLGP